MEFFPIEEMIKKIFLRFWASSVKCQLLTLSLFIMKSIKIKEAIG